MEGGARVKRTYETPKVDKLAFNYRDQVVAASGGELGSASGNENVTPSASDWAEWWSNSELREAFNSFWDWFTSLF